MDERFKRHWARWQALKAAGKSPADFLPTASDETLVELLAYAREGTAFERNVIATELTNRISRLHRAVGSHSERMNELVDENKAYLAQASRADDDIRENTATFRSETEKTSRYTSGEGTRDW